MAHDESNKKAFNGASTSPDGGGIRSTIARRTSSTPFPLLAEILITSLGSIPNVDCICAATTSGCAAGK